jgi:hypothetical protein
VTREQLEHLIRAAAAIVGEDGVIVIGSQAIHGSVDERALPAAAIESVEADLLPLDGDEAKSDLIDGSIGEASMFQESFGVYAQGVGLATAKLAPGWRDRLVPLTGAGTGGATGWCLERHDLVAAKLIAGRDKDVRFYEALRQAGLVDPSVVAERIRSTPDIDEDVRGRALAVVDRSR